MLLKFADAARAARVDPATISRAVKTGILSVSLDNHGKRRIDFAELIRVYPNAKLPDPNTDKADSTDLSLHNENESLKIQIEAMKSIISAKDELVDVREFEVKSVGDYRKSVTAKVYREYQDTLKKSNALDFDDIIVKTVELFKSCPEVLYNYQERFRYIMVD